MLAIPSRFGKPAMPAAVVFLLWLTIGLMLPVGEVAADRVKLPVLRDRTASPRVVYIENPRFPTISEADRLAVLRRAAALVKAHFAITLHLPAAVETIDIGQAFAPLAAKPPKSFARLIGDFRHDAVDWGQVEDMLIRQMQGRRDGFADQVAFAAPHLVRPPADGTLRGFAAAVAATYRHRLDHWRRARLADGRAMIGPLRDGRELPVHEYAYWALLAKRGMAADVILTNQLVASVEYIPTPVHTAIRGGVTGGGSEYNPKAQFGASVWLSLAPFLLDDPQMRALRGGRTYTRTAALDYAGTLLAHELGHLLLHLGHPWDNPACLMRPAALLDFAAWAAQLNPAACELDSSPAMTPGNLRIPIW